MLMLIIRSVGWGTNVPITGPPIGTRRHGENARVARPLEACIYPCGLPDSGEMPMLENAIKVDVVVVGVECCDLRAPRYQGYRNAGDGDVSQDRWCVLNVQDGFRNTASRSIK